MKRTNFIQRKESNKIISALTSIMVLMVVMIWTAPADARRLAPVQKKVTSIKRTPLKGKTVASSTVQKSTVRSIKPIRSLTPQRNLTSKRSKSTGKTYTKPGVRKSSMSSTRSLGVDVNGGGSGGNHTMPGVSRDPVSPQRAKCKDRRLYPTVMQQRDCECKNNPLLSPLLRQRNCKKMPKGEPTPRPPGMPGNALEAANGFASSIGGNFSSAMEGISEAGREVCHYEWVSRNAEFQGKLQMAFLRNDIDKMAIMVERGLARKVCETVYN